MSCPRRILLVAFLASCGGGGVSGDAGLDDAVEVPHDAPDVAETDAGADAAADACPPPPPAPGEVRARVLCGTADLPSGGLVSALPGDLVLENAVSRFVVRSRAEGIGLSGLRGGQLVDAVRTDLGPAGGHDGLRELALVVDFWQVAPETSPPSVIVESDGAAGEARVRVSGPLVLFPIVGEVLDLAEPPVDVVHTYSLRPDEAVIEVATTLTPRDPAGPAPEPLVGDVALLGGDSRLFVPGLGSEDLPGTAQADLLGFRSLRAASATPAYALASDAVRVVLNASGVKAFVWDSVAIPKKGRTFVRRFAAGGPDLASALSLAAPEAPTFPVSGTVDPRWPGVEVEARDEAGGPLSRCAVSESGAFDCLVPAATASVRVVWNGDGNGGLGGPGQAATGAGAEAPVAPPSAEVSLAPERPAEVAVHASLPEGAPLPFRLTLQPSAETGGEKRVAYDADGEATFLVPPGAYEAWVHHGPEHAAFHTSIDVGPGGSAAVDAVLAHLVDTAGWVSADFHVHGEHSTDSVTPMDRRLLGAVAEGLDLLVTSDHDAIADPAPVLAAAGLEGRIEVAAGVEVSTVDLGHFNVWPLAPDPERAGSGAPAWHGLAAAEILPLLRAGEPSRVVQLNHPRFSSASYFGAIDLDPGTTDPAALAFDSMELVNGIAHADTPAVLEDFQDLLDMGIRIAPTGTSDVHGDDDIVGNPRTLVFVGLGKDAPGSFTPADVVGGLRAGRSIATAGPMLTLVLEDGEGGIAEIGGHLDGSGPVTARARIQAPGWLGLGTLRIFCDRALVAEADLGAPFEDDALRDHVLEIDVAPAPSWCFAVHVPGDPSTPGIRRPPWAVTGAVFGGR